MCEIHTFRCPRPLCGRRWREYRKLASCDSVDKEYFCEEQYCMFAGRPDKPAIAECNVCSQLRELEEVMDPKGIPEVAGKGNTANLERIPNAIDGSVNTINAAAPQTAEQGWSQEQLGRGGRKKMNKKGNKTKPSHSMPTTRYPGEVKVVDIGTGIGPKPLPPGTTVVEISGPGQEGRVTRALLEMKKQQQRENRRLVPVASMDNGDDGDDGDDDGDEDDEDDEDDEEDYEDDDEEDEVNTNTPGSAGGGLGSRNAPRHSSPGAGRGNNQAAGSPSWQDYGAQASKRRKYPVAEKKDGKEKRAAVGGGVLGPKSTGYKVQKQHRNQEQGQLNQAGTMRTLESLGVTSQGNMASQAQLHGQASSHNTAGEASMGADMGIQAGNNGSPPVYPYPFYQQPYQQPLAQHQQQQEQHPQQQQQQEQHMLPLIQQQQWTQQMQQGTHQGIQPQMFPQMYPNLQPLPQQNQQDQQYPQFQHNFNNHPTLHQLSQVPEPHQTQHMHTTQVDFHSLNTTANIPGYPPPLLPSTGLNNGIDSSQRGTKRKFSLSTSPSPPVVSPSGVAATITRSPITTPIAAVMSTPIATATSPMNEVDPYMVPGLDLTPVQTPLAAPTIAYLDSILAAQFQTPNPSVPDTVPNLSYLYEPPSLSPSNSPLTTTGGGGNGNGNGMVNPIVGVDMGISALTFPPVEPNANAMGLDMGMGVDMGMGMGMDPSTNPEETSLGWGNMRLDSFSGLLNFDNASTEEFGFHQHAQQTGEFGQEDIGGGQFADEAWAVLQDRDGDQGSDGEGEEEVVG